MSKQNLLSENEIRRFQGLAGIPAISEMYHGDRKDEEEVEEGMHPDGEREEDGLEVAAEEEPEEPMGDLEMDVEMEPSDEGGDLDLSPEQKEDLAADIVRAVAQELSQALDLDEPIEVETDDEAGADLDMDMDMGGDDEELDLELGDEPAGGLEEPAPEEEPLEELGAPEEEEELEDLEESNNEDLVNEVLRRVVARLSNKQFEKQIS